MEVNVKEQNPSVVSGSSGKSRLRYPLRSATKPKEEKPSIPKLSENSAASKRRKATPIVSKSVGVLDVSGKEKSAKPPRRLSVPAKSSATPVPKSVGNITPISEIRSKRSDTVEGKYGTPLSEASRTSTRKKFSTLASASYWLSQIRLSEVAAKHSISLGFFKLALEAGCEPLQRMRDELKSYVKRYELGEMEEVVKELLQSYGMNENQEQVQVSQTCSQIPEEGTLSSEDEVRSNATSVGSRKLKPRSLNSDTPKPSSNNKSEEESSQKNLTATKTRSTLSKNVANQKRAKENESKSQKRPQKGVKQEVNKVQDKIKKQGKKIITDEGTISPSGPITEPEENKENADLSPVEEGNPTEVI